MTYAREEVLSREVADTSGPYLTEVLTVRRTTFGWNRDFDQDAPCDCGHAYYRHFDTYEDMEPVGCKYCACRRWMMPVQKAGLIPIHVKDGIIRMAFMISSDARYGGALPQISKGNREPTDESSQSTAVREAEEELGYVHNLTRDLFEIWNGEMAGMDDSYSFKLYGVEVPDPSVFVKPHFETQEVVWMTNDEFQLAGRVSHRELVQKTHDLYSANLLGDALDRKKDKWRKIVADQQLNARQ